MDSKTRDKILNRCEVLKYMGDASICSDYDQIPPDELMECHGDLLKDTSNIFDQELRLVPRDD